MPSRAGVQGGGLADRSPLSPGGGVGSAVDVPLIACVVYAAKSTEDKRGSIPDQLDDCRRVIECDAGRWIVGEYCDEAFSAFSGNRGPGLVDAMQCVADLAAERGVAELWAQHSDRLARGDGRSARHAVEIALWALKRDVQVRTVQDPDTFRDLLYAVVTGQRNHEDSRRRGAAVAAGRRRAAARGEHLGYRPDGYRTLVEVDGSGAVVRRLVIDPERQPLIEMIFALALRGRSPRAIAAAVNRAGWMTKPLFRSKEPRPWVAERIRLLLRNPRYAGLSVLRGEVLAAGQWPAYITPSQHERLRARTQGPLKASPQRESYLLSGLASCGLCGRALTARTNGRRTDGTLNRTYVCAGHLLAREAGRCDAPVISAEMLELMFVASLGSLLAGGDRDVEDLPAQPGLGVSPGVGAGERRRVIDAVLAGDERRLDATLSGLLQHRAPELALLARVAVARHGRRLELVRPFERWVQEDQLRRTEATRKEARVLGRVLRSWFSRVLVSMSETTLRIEALRRSGPGEPLPSGAAEVCFDLREWTRRRPEAKLLRRPRRRWGDAEILGALQAWQDTHAHSPTPREWQAAQVDRPCTRTVLSHFGSWDAALSRAGLEPSPAGSWRL